MRLLCPNCSAVYEVPDAALVGRSRKLQCTQCGTSWRSEPLSPDLAQVPPARLSDFEVARETAAETQHTGMQPAGIQAGEAQVADMQPESGAAAEVDPTLGLSMFLTSGDDGAAVKHQPGQGDSFADLVHAARNNEIEYEPEASASRRIISSLPLVVTLLLLLVAGLAGLAFLGHFGHFGHAA